MKNVTLLLALLFLTIAASAQFALTAGSHGLQAGDAHITQIVEYQGVGDSGANVVWDFSDLHCNGSKVSMIEDATTYPNDQRIASANIVIVDGDRHFFFDMSDKENQYLGLITPRSVIRFDNPASRMQYPFRYADSYSDTFEGTGYYGENRTTNVSGTQDAEIDAYGTLILPNGVIPNAIRLKTVSYTLEITQCQFEETRTTKYLWYAPTERYPLFVAMETEVVASDKPTETVKTAFYSDKVFTASKNKSLTTDINDFLNIEHGVKIYPNPFAEVATIEYSPATDTDVQIDLFDLNGRHLGLLLDKQQKPAGRYSLELTAADYHLAAGVYFVRFAIGQKNYVEKIILNQ